MRCCLISFLFLFLQFQSIKNMLIQTHACRATKALVSRLEFKTLKTVTKKSKGWKGWQPFMLDTWVLFG